MFYNIKTRIVGGNGGGTYTLLYYMRARKDGVNGVNGINGVNGRDGNPRWEARGGTFYPVGENVFPDGGGKIPR